METIHLHFLGAGLVVENKRLLSEQRFNCELILKYNTRSGSLKLLPTDASALGVCECGAFWELESIVVIRNGHFRVWSWRFEQ